MRKRSRRIAMALMLIASGGMVLAGPGTGCNSFLAESLLITTDFCFIFDCQNGLLGGTVDPCIGILPFNREDDNNPVGFFSDCPPIGP